jgi:hypothetical protein
MFDTGKVIAGLGVFFLLFTSPLWFNLSVGRDLPAPDLGPARNMAPACVKDTRFMRERHMDLLDEWRLAVVREGDRFLVDHGETMKWKDGAPMQKSLSNTCLKCHSNYEQFCNRCHQSSRVVLSCWNCHLNFSEGVK